MECYYHPNKEGVNTCAICGKSVCEECSLEIAGKMYCKECLEKIVGIGLNNETNEKEETQPINNKTEPARLGKQEEPQRVPLEHDYQPQEEKTIFASDLSNKLTNEKDNIYDNLTKEESIYNAPLEQEYYPKEEIAKKPIADDSPYNIKGMSYSQEYDVEPNTYLKKENAPYLEQPNINQDQRLNQANNNYQQPQNEFDYYTQEQITQQPQQDYIYPDHTYEPKETSARQALEEKYEKYLDDLYFDEPEIPLEEQLAKDEAQYGSLTKKPYTTPTQPVNEYVEEVQYTQQPIEQSYYQQEPQTRTPSRNYAEEQELDRQIRSQLNIRREEPKNSGKPIHNIKYDDGKEPYGIVDIILTIILIIAILVVVFYIVYLFFLSSSYPTFIDAVFGLQDPGELLSKLMK